MGKILYGDQGTIDYLKARGITLPAAPTLQSQQQLAVIKSKEKMLQSQQPVVYQTPAQPVSTQPVVYQTPAQPVSTQPVSKPTFSTPIAPTKKPMLIGYNAWGEPITTPSGSGYITPVTPKTTPGVYHPPPTDMKPLDSFLPPATPVIRPENLKKGKTVTTQFGDVDLAPGIAHGPPVVPDDRIDWGQAPPGYFYNAWGELVRRDAYVQDASGNQITHIATKTGIYSPQINPSETNIRQIQTLEAFKPGVITVAPGAPTLTADTFTSPDKLSAAMPYITDIKDIERLSTVRLKDEDIKPKVGLPDWYESGKRPAYYPSGDRVSTTPLPTIVGGNDIGAEIRQTNKQAVMQQTAQSPVLTQHAAPDRMVSVANGKVDIRLSQADVDRMKQGEELYFTLGNNGFDITTSPVQGNTNLALRHQSIDWGKSGIVIDANKQTVTFDTNKGAFEVLSPDLTTDKLIEKIDFGHKGKKNPNSVYYRAFYEPLGINEEYDKADAEREKALVDYNRQVRAASQRQKDAYADYYAAKSAAYRQANAAKEAAQQQSSGQQEWGPEQFAAQIERLRASGNLNTGRYVTPEATGSMGIIDTRSPVGNLLSASTTGQVDAMDRMKQNMSTFLGNNSSFSSRSQKYNTRGRSSSPKKKPGKQKPRKSNDAHSGLIYPIPNMNPFKDKSVNQSKSHNKKATKKRKTQKKRGSVTGTKIESKMASNINRFLGW